MSISDIDSAPNYLLGANNHNIASTGSSWVDNAGKFTAVSALSGLHSFYRTAQTVGNWFSGEKTKVQDTGAFISSLDSDLGRYYKANKEDADLAGFIVGSIATGLVGSAAFRAGQSVLIKAAETGKIGSNMRWATNLLVPKTEVYREMAAAEINASQALISRLNGNTWKAIGAGFHQQALESLAAETVIVATMGASPVLDNQDAFDILKNMATGAVVGGVIGGAFETAKTFGFINKARAKEDVIRNAYLKAEQPLEKLSSSDKIVATAHDLEFGGMMPLAGDLSNPARLNQFSRDSALYQQRLETGLNSLRENIRDLAGGNNSFGNLVADFSMPVLDKAKMPTPGYAQDFFERFSNADEILVPKKISKLEHAFKQWEKAGGDPDLVPDSFAYRYVKLHGDDIGAITDNLPQPMRLADMYETPEQVKRAASGFGFSSKMDAPVWNPLKLLEGKNAFREIDARYVWSKYHIVKLQKGMKIHENDIPLLTRALEDGFQDFMLVRGEGAGLNIVKNPSLSETHSTLKLAKERVSAAINEKFFLEAQGKSKTQLAKQKFGEQDVAEMAAHAADVSKDFLESDGFRTGSNSGLFARAEAKSALSDKLKVRGMSGKIDDLIDPMLLPSYAKVAYRIPPKSELDLNMANALVGIKQKEKLFESGVKSAFARVAGAKESRFFDITDRMMETATRNGGSSGALTSANGNPGTLGSMTQIIGANTKELKLDARKLIQESFQSPLYNMGNKLESSLEFESLNQFASRMPSNLKLFKFGEEAYDDALGFLVDPKALKSAAVELGKNVDELTPQNIYDYALDEGIEGFFALKHAETVAAVDTHIKHTVDRAMKFDSLKQASGRPVIQRDYEVFRPIRPNFRDYPYFSQVVDNSVTGGGQKTMIWADSPENLAKLEDRVRTLGPQYTVRNKSQIEDYFKARGEFDLQHAMNDYELDTELKRNGVLSNFFPKSDPQKIVDDVISQHMREEDLLIQSAVRTRYQKVFDQLEDFAASIDRTATSRFGGSVERLKETTNNPYTNYIKTALDVSKLPEVELWNKSQRLADNVFSKIVSPLREAFRGVASVDELDKINTVLDKYGMKPAYYDASMQALANHSAPKGELTRFVRGSNSILSLFTLGFDPLNALNNAIGSNILRGTETRHLVEAIKNGNTEIAGELAKLAKIVVPGTDNAVMSPAKLQAQAYGNFFKDLRTPGNPLLTKYKNLGFVKDHLDQFKLLLDDITLEGTESSELLKTKLARAWNRTKEFAEVAAEKGQKYSLNKLSEEMNRFVSANVMDQLTTLGQKHGLMTAQEANSYINTFVNRVDGVMLVNQRPLIFQGPIGQAIGLFQSYQFNLMQQLFRYVAEGNKKDIATLLGLQGTLYGFQSLPGFHFMNSHIVGTASGNDSHKDLYDASYGIMGKSLGDWFVYGAAANITQTNIYTRGDINPRHLTLIPTELMQVPAIGGWAKFFGNLKETSSKLMDGGNVWETVLQGIEHNGISRPMAGIAQVARGFSDGTVYSTTKQGNLLASHDLWDIASAARIVGGRPLDEALVHDGIFRKKFYEIIDKEKRAKLAEVTKTHLLNGDELPAETAINLADQYAATGGKQAGFNKWMMELYKDANVSQADQLKDQLGNPMTYKLQLLMEGDN